jgi:hypothetical protein
MGNIKTVTTFVSNVRSVHGLQWFKGAPQWVRQSHRSAVGFSSQFIPTQSDRASLRFAFADWARSSCSSVSPSSSAVALKPITRPHSGHLGIDRFSTT